jgi:hypothetical protein
MTVPTVTLIPISQIYVLNPRSRNKVVFQGIVANIAAPGLKKPIRLIEQTTMSLRQTLLSKESPSKRVSEHGRFVIQKDSNSTQTKRWGSR